MTCHIFKGSTAYAKELISDSAGNHDAALVIAIEAARQYPNIPARFFADVVSDIHAAKMLESMR